MLALENGNFYDTISKCLHSLTLECQLANVESMKQYYTTESNSIKNVTKSRKYTVENVTYQNTI